MPGKEMGGGDGPSTPHTHPTDHVTAFPRRSVGEKRVLKIPPHLGELRPAMRSVRSSGLVTSPRPPPHQAMATAVLAASSRAA